MHINGYIACYTARGTVAHVARAAIHSLLGQSNGWCNKLYTHMRRVAYISYIHYIYYLRTYIHRPHYIQHYTNRLKYSASEHFNFLSPRVQPPWPRTSISLDPSIPSMKSSYDTSIIILHITYLSRLLRIYIT